VDLAHLTSDGKLVANLSIDLEIVEIGIWIRTGAPRPDNQLAQQIG